MTHGVDLMFIYFHTYQHISNIVLNDNIVQDIFLNLNTQRKMTATKDIHPVHDTVTLLHL